MNMAPPLADSGKPYCRSSMWSNRFGDTLPSTGVNLTIGKMKSSSCWAARAAAKSCPAAHAGRQTPPRAHPAGWRDVTRRRRMSGRSI